MCELQRDHPIKYSIQNPFNFNSNEYKIQKVKKFNYLGVIIGEDRNENIQEELQAGNKAFMAIRRYLKTERLAD